MNYLKLFTDFDESLSMLEDAEVGRLIRALLRYAANGEITDLPGNERFLWPVSRQSVDREAATYENICKRNRKNRLGDRAEEAEPSGKKASRRAEKALPATTEAADPFVPEKAPCGVKEAAAALLQEEAANLFAEEAAVFAEETAAEPAEEAAVFADETVAEPAEIPEIPLAEETVAEPTEEAAIPLAEEASRVAARGSAKADTGAVADFMDVPFPSDGYPYEEIPLPEDAVARIIPCWDEALDGYRIPDEADETEGLLPDGWDKADEMTGCASVDSGTTLGDKPFANVRKSVGNARDINGSDVASRVVQDKDKDKDSKETPLTGSERKRRWRAPSSGTEGSLPGDETNGHRSSRSHRADPPTLEEVRSFCAHQGLSVDAERFFRFYEAGNWLDSNGRPVRNWRQKLLTWNNFDTRRAKSAQKYPCGSPTARPGMGADAPYEQHLLSDAQLDALLVDLDAPFAEERPVAEG